MPKRSSVAKIVNDCPKHSLEHCLMSYGTVWVDKPSTFVVSGVVGRWKCKKKCTTEPGEKNNLHAKKLEKECMG